MKTILAAVCGSACLLSVSSARADVTFCNNYSSKIWVAVGVYDLDSDWNNCSQWYGGDEMIGWYPMTPGNCTTVIGGCANADWIDFHAEAADGARWAGPDDVGLVSTSAFDFCYGTTVCPNNLCAPFNYGKVGFRTVVFDNQCGILGQGGFEGTIDLN